MDSALHWSIRCSSPDQSIIIAALKTNWVKPTCLHGVFNQVDTFYFAEYAWTSSHLINSGMLHWFTPLQISLPDRKLQLLYNVNRGPLMVHFWWNNHKASLLCYFSVRDLFSWLTKWCLALYSSLIFASENSGELNMWFGGWAFPTFWMTNHNEFHQCQSECTYVFPDFLSSSPSRVPPFVHCLHQ